MPVFIKKLRRLARYIPIIWKGGDWDYAYALGLFQYKLEDLAAYYKDNPGHYVGQDKTYRRLLIMLEHLKQFTQDDFKPKHLYDRFSKPTCDINNIDQWLNELGTNKHAHIFIQANTALQEYHWGEFCKYINKYMRRFWI